MVARRSSVGLAAVAAMSGFAACGAQAQSVPASSSGFYIGASGGYAWGTSKNFNTALPAPPPQEEADDGKFKLDGGMAGASLGYNWLVARTLFGIEGDYSASRIDGTGDCSGDRCGGSLRWFGSARFRFGYDIGGLIPYLTGGLAIAGLEAFDESPPGYSGFRIRPGWTIGAGVESSITSTVSWKVEYLYADLGTKAHYTTAGHTPEQIEVNASSIRIGLNLRISD